MALLVISAAGIARTQTLVFTAELSVTALFQASNKHSRYTPGFYSLYGKAGLAADELLQLELLHPHLSLNSSLQQPRWCMLEGPTKWDHSLRWGWDAGHCSSQIRYLHIPLLSLQGLLDKCE